MTCSVPLMLTAAADLADRLADLPDDNGRSSQSLASGTAGVALLHIERAASGYGDWSTAHGALSAAAHDDISAGANASLFFGAPAVAFVTHAAADKPGKLTRALADLDVGTIAMTQRRLEAAHTRIDRGARPALAEFDLIRGLTGLGAYHLRRHTHDDITMAVLAYLVRLTEPLPHSTDELPGWWTDLGPTGQPSPEFPYGHGNNGMAHGVAGPLALLSLALWRGVVVEGHSMAIARICTWMDSWRRERPCGPWWPRIITLDDVYTGHSTRPGNPGQPSWCYGTPGMARAQQLAGLATGDAARQRTAEAALHGCLSDPTQLAQITEPGLCHGTAGLLQITSRMAADACIRGIGAQLPQLVAKMLAQHRSARREPGLLTGTAGVALALHTAGTGTAPATSWDSCLLLS